MKNKAINHAERRKNAIPEAWRPQEKIKPVKDEPKPVRQTAPSGFSKADIERLKQKAAGRRGFSPAAAKPVYETFNIEQGMPQAETALRRAEVYLTGAAARGIKAVKLIHGWGSSGKGGLIKQLIGERMEAHPCVICAVPGENFSHAHPAAEIMKGIPGVWDDPDRGRSNPGITVVLLRKK